MAIKHDLNLKIIYKFSLVAQLAILSFRASMFLKLWSFFPYLDELLSAFFCLFVAAKLLSDLVNGRIQKKVLLTMIVGTAIVGAVVFCVREKTVFQMAVYWLYICGAHDIDYEEIIKIAGKTLAICTAIIVLSGLVGLIENIEITQIAFERVRNRTGLGYYYVTQAAKMLFFIILYVFYIKKEKVSWIEIITFLGLAVFFYIKTDTRWEFFLSILTLIIVAIYKLFGFVKEYNILHLIISFLSAPLSAMFMIVIGLYGKVDTIFLEKLNRILTGRVVLTQSAFSQYGVPLFGQKILWSVGENGEAYNYVDSGYPRFLMNYGIVFLIALLVIIMIMAVYARKKKDAAFAIVLTMITVHSAFEPELLWMHYNSFMFVYSYCMNSGKSLRSAL